MEPEVPCLQLLSTCPYSEPDQSSPWLSTPLPVYIYILILYSYLILGLPSGLLPPGLPTRTLNAPLLSAIRATCTSYLSFLFDQPNNIWWGILLNSSLYIFLDSLLTGPSEVQIFSNTLSLPSSLNVRFPHFLHLFYVPCTCKSHIIICNSFTSFLVRVSFLGSEFEFRWPWSTLHHYIWWCYRAQRIIFWSTLLGIL